MIVVEVYYRDQDQDAFDELYAAAENGRTEGILKRLDSGWKKIYRFEVKDDDDWDSHYKSYFADPIQLRNRDAEMCEDVFRLTNSPYGNLLRTDRSRARLLTEFSHWHRSNMEVGDIVSITRDDSDKLYRCGRRWHILSPDDWIQLNWGGTVTS